MGKLKKAVNYFSKTELLLWTLSEILITVSFILFGGGNYLSLASSVIGTTALLFFAKGNYFGHILGIIFSFVYMYISYTCSYYGEVMIYIFMNLPMSFAALYSWIKNPSEESRTEVRVGEISVKEAVFVAVTAALVTAVFYFVLKHFGTANLIASTVSVATSFIAVSLSVKRSPYYAAAYAANDIVLIVLWSMASARDSSYIGVVICFAVFLVNDIYCFFNWRRIREKQRAF